MDKSTRCTLLTLAILGWLAGWSSAGSCAAAKLCCQGRDSGCVIQKASPNAIIESPRDKPCYCDHACLRLGDCCDDFNETCGAMDCAVGEWSDWTDCNNKCGAGYHERSRLVVREARNAGKPCPELGQRAACQNYDACRRRARHFQVEEAAQTGPTLDGSNFVPQITRGYCAAFTILKISRGCRRRLESFHEGSRVCVWCRPSSATSSCRYSESTLAGIGRWELTSSPAAKHCHGKWLAEPSTPVSPDSCASSACRGRPLLAFI